MVERLEAVRQEKLGLCDLDICTPSCHVLVLPGIRPYRPRTSMVREPRSVINAVEL